MASRKGRGASAHGSSASTSISETLSRLGMTQEQFQAKQAELLTVLLQNQPFIPQNGIVTRPITALEGSMLVQATSSRSRSTSVSSDSSRATSPAFPRTPSRSHQPEVVPPRPRDQMELILEAKNRRKERQRRGVFPFTTATGKCKAHRWSAIPESTSRSREDERVFLTPSRGSDKSGSSNVRKRVACFFLCV